MKLCAHMKCIPVVGADSLIIIFMLIYLRNCIWNRAKCTECDFPMIFGSLFNRTNHWIICAMIFIGVLRLRQNHFKNWTASFRIFFEIYLWSIFEWIWVASPLSGFFFYLWNSHTKIDFNIIMILHCLVWTEWLPTLL